MLPHIQPCESTFFVQVAAPVKMLRIEINNIIPGITLSETFVKCRTIAKIKNEHNVKR